jgi:hypothetical protein
MRRLTSFKTTPEKIKYTMSKTYNFITDLDQDPYIHTNSCLYCGTENVIKIDQEDYIKWKVQKTYIQEVFPWLDKEQRELLISGTHPQCWDEVFPDDDEQDPYLLEILDAQKGHP